MLGSVGANGNVGGRYVDDTPLQGVVGTDISQVELNAMFFEILSVVKGIGLAPNPASESQLFESIVLIARRESGLIPLELEMTTSPQTFNLINLGVPVGNYHVSLTLLGANEYDQNISGVLTDMNLTLHSWYTNAEGNRVPGVPEGKRYNGWGQPYGGNWGGEIVGSRTQITVMLTARRQSLS
jgi:hypothetical protein